MLCCANNWMCNMDFKYVFTLLNIYLIVYHSIVIKVNKHTLDS